MGAHHFIRGAAIGALFASAAALLLAPKSGKKTREDITRMSKDLSERLGKELDSAEMLSRERYDDIVKKTVSEYSRGKKLTTGLVNDLSSVLGTYFEEVKKEIHSLKGNGVKKNTKKSTKKKQTKK